MDSVVDPSSPPTLRVGFFGTSIMEHFEPFSRRLLEPGDPLEIGSSVVVDGFHKRGWVHDLHTTMQVTWPSLRFDWDNQGLGGATSRTVLTIVGDYVAAQPRLDLAVVGCGINDVWRRFDGHPDEAVSAQEYAENYRRIVALLLEHSRRLVCVAETPFGWDPEVDVDTVNAEISRYNDLARAAAAEHGADWIDVWPAFTDPAWRPARGLAPPPGTPTLWTDGVHLSEWGDVLLARLVAAHLDQAGVVESLTG